MESTSSYGPPARVDSITTAASGVEKARQGASQQRLNKTVWDRGGHCACQDVDQRCPCIVRDGSMEARRPSQEALDGGARDGTVGQEQGRALGAGGRRSREERHQRRVQRNERVPAPLLGPWPDRRYRPEILLEARHGDPATDRGNGGQTGYGGRLGQFYAASKQMTRRLWWAVVCARCPDDCSADDLACVEGHDRRGVRDTGHDGIDVSLGKECRSNERVGEPCQNTHGARYKTNILCRLHDGNSPGHMPGGPQLWCGDGHVGHRSQRGELHVASGVIARPLEEEIQMVRNAEERSASNAGEDANEGDDNAVQRLRSEKVRRHISHDSDEAWRVVRMAEQTE